jgi:hypothetical protein
MRIHFVLFIITLGSSLFSCRSSISENEHTLIAGKGFDNIEVEKTPLTEIIETCGNNFSIDTFYTPIFTPNDFLTVDSVDRKRIYSIKYAFNNLGLAFFFRSNQQTPFSILIYSPFKGITDKGIILNKSTFNDVIKKYGETSWSFSGNTIMKSYEGISFEDTVDAINMTDPDPKWKKRLRNKITAIVIKRIK